jgi:hypothetical protein
MLLSVSLVMPSNAEVRRVVIVLGIVCMISGLRFYGAHLSVGNVDERLPPSLLFRALKKRAISPAIETS